MIGETAGAVLERAIAVDTLINSVALTCMDDNNPIMDADAIQKHYTLSEVSELTGFKVRSLRHYIKTGDLQAVRFGRDYRVPGAELAAFIETMKAREVPAPQRPGRPAPRLKTDQDGGA